MLLRLTTLLVTLQLVLTTVVTAQDPGGDRANRDRGNRGVMPLLGGGGAPVIAVGENSLFVFLNGTVKRLDKKTLQVQAEKSLEEGGDEQDAFATLDRNGDGKLTTDEVPLPAELFANADKNKDGVITKDEVPAGLLDRFSGKAMRRLAAGPATLTVDKGDAALFVYYMGTLYRLDGKTLNVDAKIQLVEDVGAALMQQRGERKAEKKKDEQAPKDFPPPAEPVF
jgi:hypothetical protein